MRICGDHDTGRTLALSGYPLGLVCHRCPYRHVLTARQLRAHEHDRRSLRRLPLLCRCGACGLALYLFEAAAEVPAFLSGDLPNRADAGHLSYVAGS